MPQVLKESVRKNIREAAAVVFYEKNYISATMKEIAERAGIPVGLVYSYYKNKASLFDDVVEPAYASFTGSIEKEERWQKSSAENFRNMGLEPLLELLREHRRLVMLTDKSQGTRHEHAKEELIGALENHIRTGLNSHSKECFDEMLVHILASNFTESLLEIARHYKNEKWAEKMLELVVQCYFHGVGSLFG